MGLQALQSQPHEHQPVAERRLVVRLYLGEAEAPVQRQGLGLARAGVQVHARVPSARAARISSAPSARPAPRPRAAVLTNMRFISHDWPSMRRSAAHPTAMPPLPASRSRPAGGAYGPGSPASSSSNLAMPKYRSMTS